MMDRHEVKDVINEVLKESTMWQIHEAHHEWVQLRIDGEKARTAMCQEITKSIIQWSIVGILGYLGLWIKEHFIK